MISTTRLRATIGWIGILLPWLVLLMSMVYGCGFQNSISATYYIPTCITSFMTIFGSASLLLFNYKGYDKQDDIVCSIAGFLAIGICLCSCSTKDLIEKLPELAYQTNVGAFQIAPFISGIVHNICVINFFGLLAYNSLFLFTKSVVKDKKKMTECKRKRNVIFRICGIGMVVSLLAIIFISIFEWRGGVLVIETTAFTFFGVSWLTKANHYHWLFADKE